MLDCATGTWLYATLALGKATRRSEAAHATIDDFTAHFTDPVSDRPLVLPIASTSDYSG